MSVFLTQLASDNFQRGNISPLASPWTLDTAGNNGLQIVSEVCEPIGGNFSSNGQYYTYAGMPNDQYASCTLGSYNTGLGFAFLFVRATDTGTSFNFTHGYCLDIGGGDWSLTSGGLEGSLLASGSATVAAGDVWTLAVIGTEVYVIQNSVQLGSVSNATYSGGLTILGLFPEGATPSVTNFAMGSASTTPPTYSLSGNAGVAAATVAYSGTASGSVTADGSGNYTISGLSNGSYTLTASLTGYTFTGPTPANPQIISGANITGVNFVATPVPSGAWSQEDCRTFGNFPNLPINVQGTETYTKPSVDSRRGGGPIDSRAGGPVVDSREGYPANSRTAPPFKS